MLTAELLSQSFEAVVTSYIGDVRFYTLWSNALDKSEAHLWPKLYWRQPTVGMVVDVPTARVYNTYQVAFSVLGQVASDRTADEGRAKHSEMASLATMLLARYASLYVLETTEYQGVAIDLTMGPVTMQPVWDAENMATGVVVDVTFTDTRNLPCFDAYFA